MSGCQTCGHDDASACFCNAPIICPGCYSVGEEPCAADCIDAEIAREANDSNDDHCVLDDSTECDCSGCRADDARWESWQGWDADDSFVTNGDDHDR